MRTDESNNKHLIAEDGKVFRRISDGWIAADASTEPPDDLPPEPPRVTLADYRALERKVEMIMRLLGINYNNN